MLPFAPGFAPLARDADASLAARAGMAFAPVPAFATRPVLAALVPRAAAGFRVPEAGLARGGAAFLAVAVFGLVRRADAVALRAASPREPLAAEPDVARTPVLPRPPFAAAAVRPAAPRAPVPDAFRVPVAVLARVVLVPAALVPAALRVAAPPPLALVARRVGARRRRGGFSPDG